VLAHDEIDRLFDHKALTNWKRFTKDGEQEVGEIKRDEDGTICENLIIKGNNLLALHSLKKQFAGKVKLIYIDPPYNTGNDGFKYNDNFNHSTWLTFMKNRLEIARELLRDDGVIFVQCDDNEQAYLKVLMDDIFGRQNFVVNNVYKRRKTQANLTKHIAPIHEHIICFSKNIEQLILYNLPLKDDYIKKMYKNPDNDPRGLWRLAPLLRPANSKNREFELTMPNGRIIKGKWSCSEETFNQYIKNNLLYITEEGSPNKKIFLNDSKGQIPNSWLDEISTTEEASKEIEELFGSNDAFSYSKPEGIIKYIIQISTQPNDIVLDYHLGSGTTAAVAHKMGRQYIGVEQMDYIETIACERLRKVIQGEQGGISKSVNWQGGGDFIYFELAKLNETAKEKIFDCESLEELEAFFDEMYERYFLNYNLKIKEFKEKVLQEENFRNLSLDEQKKIFVAMLDNNQMYVNKTEMADKKFGISEEDQNLTNQFYNS
jgi:adenine-specific DNA-methyltransferase